MNLSEIKYQEHYLYEKPDGNYWRGITVTINNIRMLDIGFHTEMYNGDTLCISLGSGIIPYLLFAGPEEINFVTMFKDQEDWETGLGGNKFKLEDKELVKARAVEIIEKYFSLFECNEEVT